MGKNNLQIDRDKKQTTMERVFDASRELLWKAHTDPELIPQWWGPRGYETVVEKMDVTPGGEWRFIHKAKDEKGKDASYAFYGVYKDLKELEYITWTFNYEPIGLGHEITETVSFVDLGDGKTKVSVVSRYNTIEDLEGMVQSGMEKGATETWDRLEELAAKLG